MFHKTSELFEFNKMLFIYLLSGAIGAIWLSRMIIQKRIIIKNTLFSLPLLAFLVSQIFSTLFSIDVHTSLFGYYGRFNGGLFSICAYMLLYFAFVSNFTSLPHIKKIERQMLASSLLGSVMVIVWGLPSRFGFDLSCFVFTGKLDVACWTDQFQPTIRIFSTLGQPNWLGAYLAVNFFIGLYFLLRVIRTKKLFYMYAAYLFFNMLMLLYTRSRSALLAVGAGMIMVAIYLLKTYSNFLRKKEFRIPVAVVVGALLFALLIGKTGIAGIDRFILFSQTQKQEVAAKTGPSPVITDSFTIRKIVWQGGFNLGLMYPLFGTGVETFAYAYNFVRPLAHNATSEWDYVYNKAHNEFVNYLATTGFVGLLAYLVLVATVVSQSMHAFKKNALKHDDKLLLILLVGAYLSILITNFFGFSITVTNMYLYLIPAFMVSILSLPLTSTSVPNVAQKNEILAPRQRVLLGATGIAFFGLVISLGSYWLADIHYAKGDNTASVHDYGNSIGELYAAYNLRKDALYADKISSVLAQVTFVESSQQNNGKVTCPAHDGTIAPCAQLVERYSAEALNASPKNVYFYRTLARNDILLYQATNDEKYYQKALGAIKKARALAPTDPHYPYTQALFYLAKYENTKNPHPADASVLENGGLGAANFALSLKKDYRDAYYAKGLILKQLGRKSEAKDVFNGYLNQYDAKDSQFLDELKGL